MEQTKDRINNGAVKKSSNNQIVSRRRISSDTAIIPASKKPNLYRIKTSSRLPLQDLSTNVSKLNEKTENNIKTIVSGFISKVTETKLKSRDLNKTVSSPPKQVFNKCSVSTTTKLINTKSCVNLPKPGTKLLKNKLTTIEPNRTSAIQDKTKQLKRPAKKISLSHKLPLKQRRRNDAYVVLDIYNTEYLEDIIECELKNDWKFVLRPNSLKQYSDQLRESLVQGLSRAIEYFEQPSSILFSTVRVFDYILDTTDIPLNLLQLVSYIIMWIVIKFDSNTNYISARRLADICNNPFTTVSDILKMEQKILKFLDFNLIVSDVTVFTNFYIKKLRETNEHLHNSVDYILECLSLSKNFSMVTPSKQAAGAVCLALDILQAESSSWRTLASTFGFYHHHELNEVMQIMLEQIHKIQDPSYEYRFSYEKYATKEKQGVSVVLLRKLIGS